MNNTGVEYDQAKAELIKCEHNFAQAQSNLTPPEPEPEPVRQQQPQPQVQPPPQNCTVEEVELPEINTIFTGIKSALALAKNISWTS